MRLKIHGWVVLALMGGSLVWAKAPSREVPPVPRASTPVLVEPLVSWPHELDRPESLPEDLLASAVVLTEGPIRLRAGTDATSLGLIIHVSLTTPPQAREATHDHPSIREGGHLLVLLTSGEKAVFELACNVKGQFADSRRAGLKGKPDRSWTSGASVLATTLTNGMTWVVALPLTAVGWENWPPTAQLFVAWEGKGSQGSPVWHPVKWPPFKPDDGPAFLGVQFSEANLDGITDPNVRAGAWVAGVVEGSPAAQGGLQVGDIVTGINGKPLDFVDDLPATIQTFAPGRHISVQYLRQGTPGSVDVMLTPRPKDAVSDQPAEIPPDPVEPDPDE